MMLETNLCRIWRIVITLAAPNVRQSIQRPLTLSFFLRLIVMVLSTLRGKHGPWLLIKSLNEELLFRTMQWSCKLNEIDSLSDEVKVNCRMYVPAFLCIYLLFPITHHQWWSPSATFANSLSLLTHSLARVVKLKITIFIFMHGILHQETGVAWCSNPPPSSRRRPSPSTFDPTHGFESTPNPTHGSELFTLVAKKALLCWFIHPPSIYCECWCCGALVWSLDRTCDPSLTICCTWSHLYLSCYFTDVFNSTSKRSCGGWDESVLGYFFGIIGQKSSYQGIPNDEKDDVEIYKWGCIDRNSVVARIVAKRWPATLKLLL